MGWKQFKPKQNSKRVFVVKQGIQFEDVAFSYGKKTLFNDFSLRISTGEFVAIVGANGSGKTTLLQLLSGMLTPSAGKITIDGIDVQEDDDMVVARTLLSVVLQNPENQFVGATVEEDIAFGLENKRKSKAEMDAIIARVSKQMKLQPFLKKAPHELSGGQKQRVALASSLAMETKYLLLDEATSQLDPAGKREVLLAVADLAKRKDKTVIMITHDLSEILHAQRVIVLQQGEIVADMTPQKLFSEYQAELSTYNLVLPRVVAYSTAFQAAGLLTDDAYSIEELVDKLCK